LLATMMIFLAGCRAGQDDPDGLSAAEQDIARATERATAAETAVEPPQANTPAAESSTLDTLEGEDDRPGILGYLGRPDAFTISLTLVDGAIVRTENWRYYQFGTRVDFVDGIAVWTIDIEPMPDGTMFAAWYDPLAFETGMTESEVAALVAGASPAGEAPTRLALDEGGADLEGGVVLAGDQIMIGLSDDQLVYVETVALVPEGEDQ
jgi:hypothetical protein